MEREIWTEDWNIIDPINGNNYRSICENWSAYWKEEMAFIPEDLYDNLVSNMRFVTLEMEEDQVTLLSSARSELQRWWKIHDGFGCAW